MSDKPLFEFEDDYEKGALSVNCQVFSVQSAKAIMSPENALKAFLLMNEVADRSDITALTARLGYLEVDGGDENEESGIEADWVGEDNVVRDGEVVFEVFDDNATSETVQLTVDRSEIEGYLLRNGLVHESELRGRPAPSAPTP